MSDRTRIAELESSLFFAALALAAQESRLDVFGRENAHLRVVAQNVSCLYGHRAPSGACDLGYPGCACMDDLICAFSYEPASDEQAYQMRLQKRAAELGSRVGMAASFFKSLAEGFTRAREPSKAAACENMAALMEDPL